MCNYILHKKPNQLFFKFMYNTYYINVIYHSKYTINLERERINNLVQPTQNSIKKKFVYLRSVVTIEHTISQRKYFHSKYALSTFFQKKKKICHLLNLFLKYLPRLY